MNKELNWTKKAFNRTIEFNNANGESVGSIKFRLFDNHVEGELYGKKILFDIHGFINKEVEISDEQNNNLGKILLGFRSKAAVKLANGEEYIWHRANFFMTQWELIHDLPNTDNDPVIIEYDRERHFLNEAGNISLVDVQENAELLTLIGFFVGFYYLRRRRRVAAVAIGGGMAG
jgi:hypothetical protein